MSVSFFEQKDGKWLALSKKGLHVATISPDN